MEKMNNNELENELTEVTGGAGNAGDKGKKSDLTPKLDSKTFTCRMCKEEYPSSEDGKDRRFFGGMCDKCLERMCRFEG